GWNGITGTPNGHYLVAGAGVVQEIDATGKKVWEYQAAGACYASRLPNGNTPVVSNGQTSLAEVNRKGETVWSQKTDTSLWRGRPAMPRLRAARTSGDREFARRAEALAQDIETTGPSLPVAAARLLARHKPPEAAGVLLAYLPHADDDGVEEEVLNALLALAP